MDTIHPQWDEFIYVDHNKKKAIQKIHTPEGEPNKKCRVGYWDFIDGTLDQLIDQCKKYKKVFIYLHGQARDIQNNWKIKYFKKARWLWELQNHFRGRIDFIPFGLFDYEIYLCMGMAGGGRDMSIFYERRVIFPDGRRPEPGSAKKWGPYQYWRDKYPDMSSIGLSFMLWQMAPQFNKEYYDRSYEQEYAKKRYSKALQMTEVERYNFYFCNNYRNTTKPGAKNSQHAKTKLNNIRPDQHRWLENDGFACDTCSLSYCCRLYKRGHWCVVGKTKGVRFAEKFKTGKVSDVLEGMQMVLGKQAELLEDHIERVEVAIATDSEIPKGDTQKMINDLMRNSIAFAKIKDPNLTKQTVALSIDGGQKNGVIEGEVVDDVKQLEDLPDRDKAALIREMTTYGYKRESISKEDMVKFLASKNNKTNSQPAIEGGVF